MSVRHALLALLSDGPKYGLQLRQEFELRTGEVWPLNVGQVYTTLHRLERDGMVESDNSESDGAQKGYAITDAGASELDRWLTTPADLLTPPRDELVIKVLVATSVSGVDVHEIIQGNRRVVVEAMQQFTHLKSESNGNVGLALILDAEIFRLEALVRWLDSADVRLPQLPPGTSLPAPAAVPRFAGRRLSVSQ